MINGDVLEMATRGSIGGIYDTLRPKEQRMLAVKYLKPLADAGKILSYVDGNHEARAAKDTDEYTGELICTMLGIPSVYDPDGAFLFLSVGYDRAKGESNRNIYTLYMLHGWSGSRMVGGKANNLESLAKSVVADIYLSSHTHTKITFSRRTLIPESRSKTLRWKKQLFVSAGSFLEWSGYAIRRGYSPATLGSPRIRLDGRRHDAHCSL